jgi:hypothetical protein
LHRFDSGRRGKDQHREALYGQAREIADGMVAANN